MQAGQLQRAWWIAACLLVASPAKARAQTNLQLWGNFTLDWVRINETDRRPEFHLFSRAMRYHPRERAPARRWVLRDLVRVEYRNLFYSGGDTTSSSTVRGTRSRIGSGSCHSIIDIRVKRVF